MTRAGFRLFGTGRYTPRPGGVLSCLRRVRADVVARRRVGRDGFTLLETLVVMLVLSLLATGYYAPQMVGELRRIQRVQADVVAHEISSLGAAAQAYTLAHAGAWPLENSDCSDAHQALTDRLPPEAFSRDTVFFRSAVEEADPPSEIEGEERLVGRYYFDCGENSDGDRPLFQVSLDFSAGDAAWADYVANQLPNSSVAPDGDVRRLEIGWPKPAALPAFDAFVLKAEPLFEGNLDVNGNSIFAADEVILSSGQTLASALQYAGVASPGNRVNKPDCPAGLVPQVVTVPLEMSHAEGQPLTHFRVYATDSGSTWRIRSTVHGSGSQSLDAAARVRVGVFTLCS